MGITVSIAGITVETNMQDRAFPNAVDGATGQGLRQWLDGERKANKREIRKALGKSKPFPFHPAERSARECRGTFSRMNPAYIRRYR